MEQQLVNRQNPALHIQHQPFFPALPVQAKLTIGRPDDPYEREADAMADKVMRMPDKMDDYPSTFFRPAPDFVQRKCAHCEEEEKKKLQRKTTITMVQRQHIFDSDIPAPNLTLSDSFRFHFTPAPDYLAMRRPFIDRNILHLWDPDSALQVWQYNFNFFRGLGLSPDLSNSFSNLTAPRFIDSQLKAGNPSWWEITDRELNTSSVMGSIPLLELGPDFSPGAPSWFRTIFQHGDNAVHRKCRQCEEESELHRKEEKATSIEEKTALNDYVEKLNGKGQPLPAETRIFFEPRFGYNFSDVHIHTDDKAARSAQDINALAYTVGNNIVFNSGQYAPHTDPGKKLLAHELTHTIQQKELTPSLRSEIKIVRQDMDAGVSYPRDASLPGGVPESTQQDSISPQNTRQPHHPVQSPVCTTRFHRAATFQSLIDLVRAAETRLNAANITSTRDQIHALRGIYYGTTWSQDYAVERSTTRNEGFQRFTRPSVSDPNTTVPRDVRTILDCGLFNALKDSQDMVDGGRHFDFGHLIIGLDARLDPSFNANVQYPNPIPFLPNIDLGGTGTELVTWLGDLGGGAAALAIRRVSVPTTNASAVFTGSDYGGSINLEGDIAAFVVATAGTPSTLVAPSFMIGSGRLSDALQAYLTPGSMSTLWTNRATTFLRMYGGIFNSSNTLTNSAALISAFQRKIQDFACNYLASRVKDHHITFQQAKSASHYVYFAAQEVATAFVNALIDSHVTGRKIEATRFPSPTRGTSSACLIQITAGSALGIF